ncbi:MAG: hypothetical protein QXI12_06535 [Candidatus Methanomethyliaceae archaeon]
MAEEGAPDPFPGPVLQPLVEALPTGGRGAVLSGHVGPRASCLEDVEDAVEGAAGVGEGATSAGFSFGQEGLDDLPLFIGQFMSAHACGIA